MVGTFGTLLPDRKAIVGLVLCAGYFYYSASLANLRRNFE